MKSKALAFFLCLFVSLLYFRATAQEDTLNVSKLSGFSLDELLNVNVVTASKAEQKMTEAPSTIFVITAQQIAERGYEELDDALRDLPGIDLVHVYGLQHGKNFSIISLREKIPCSTAASKKACTATGTK